MTLFHYSYHPLGSVTPVPGLIHFQNGISSIVSLGPENPQTTVSILCTIIESGSFEWTWEHESIQLATDDRFQVQMADASRTSILLINNPRHIDYGSYTCMAKHTAGSIYYNRTNELKLNGR